MTWFEAYERSLLPLLAPAEMFGLLTSVEASGMLAALRTASTAEDIAVTTGQPPHLVRAVVRALVAHDIAVLEGQKYRLSPDWMVLSDEAAFSPLSVQLAKASVDQRSLRSLLDPEDYWTMPPEDRLVVARAVSPDPFSAGLVESFRAMVAADPDQEVLTRGGTHLELGCGVAGRILTTLQAVPAMRAIGVEISPDLAAVAQERAERLGVSERFEVVVGDVADFAREGCADTAFWSQFFFPEPSRAGDLAAALRALKPGGVLTATLIGTVQDERAVALSEVSLAGWGVPSRTGDELVDEVTRAGFAEATIVDRGGLVRVRAIRP